MLQAKTSLSGTLVGRLLASVRARSPLRRYGFAIVLPLLALSTTISLTNLSQNPFFPLFSLAVAISSIFGGMGPGLVTVAMSTVINLLLVPPSWSLRIASVDNATRLGLFALAGVAFAVMIGAAGEFYNNLQIQHSELMITLRSIGDAVIATGIDGRVTFMNPVAEVVTGCPLEQWRGAALKEVFRIVNEDTREELPDLVRTVLETGAAIGLANHTALIRRDDALIPIDDSAAPIRDPQNNVIGVVIIFRDVSQVRSTESALRRADRLAVAGKLAATVAHEMNNPLEAVVNLVYLAIENDSLSGSTKKHLELAQSELRRAIESSRRILSFRQAENRQDLVNLENLVSSVLDLYSTTAASRGIAIKNDIEMGINLPLVESEMRQLINNLVSNAIDSMPRGGTLRISSAAESDGALRMIVSDTGHGIATDHMRQIFEPFFTTKHDVGAGLGLWVAKRIAEEHGGELLVESTASGSTFTLVLPGGNGSAASHQSRCTLHDAESLAGSSRLDYGSR